MRDRVRDLQSSREELLAEVRRLTADTEEAATQLLAAQDALDARLAESGVPVRPWPEARPSWPSTSHAVEQDRRHRAQLLHRAAQLDADVDRAGDELERAERHAAALVAALEGRQAEAQEATEAADTAQEALEELVRWWAADLTELHVRRRGADPRRRERRSTSRRSPPRTTSTASARRRSARRPSIGSG